MTKRGHDVLLHWGPVVVWAAIIYFWSSRAKSTLPENPNDTVDFIIKKTAHVSEYAILAVLLWRAFSHTLRERRRWHPWVIVSLCAAYAVSDEFHQQFVAGRGPSPRDVMIDIAGASAGLLIVSIILARRRRNPLWLQHFPWLDRFLGGLLPLRLSSQDNPPE